MRELYKPKPDREIVHAHQYALSENAVSSLDIKEEHIVAKTQRLLDQLLLLGKNLSLIGSKVGIIKSSSELVGFSKEELRADGWIKYPILSRLAKVAPLDLSQSDFLSRCKTLHEVWQKIPNEYLKGLLGKAGCPSKKIETLGSLKLLQGLVNIIQMFNKEGMTMSSFISDKEPMEWKKRNPAMAPLFINNDLRIADAHETQNKCKEALTNLGFDIAHLNEGYGCALDFVMDAVIKAFKDLNENFANIIHRGI